MILDYKGIEVHVLKSLFKIAVYKLLKYLDEIAVTGTFGGASISSFAVTLLHNL